MTNDHFDVREAGKALKAPEMVVLCKLATGAFNPYRFRPARLVATENECQKYLLSMSIYGNFHHCTDDRLALYCLLYSASISRAEFVVFWVNDDTLFLPFEFL